MAAYKTEDIRNIVLMGPAGSGKTSLAEVLLHEAGATKSLGSLERGTTVCDFDAKERELQHSLETAVCSLDYQGIHANIVDTPGYPDFIGRSVSVLPAVESAVLVINAQAGMETGVRRLMDAAQKDGLCRMVVINKIDADDTDLEATLSAVQEVLGNGCLPLNLPSENGASIQDCFFTPEGGQTDFSSVEEAHTKIIDQVVEVDDELMELYLESAQDLDPGKLHDAFEKALREGHLVPVCFTSAEKSIGIKKLLEVIHRLLPSPLEGNPPSFKKGEADDAAPVEVTPDPGNHVVAHVFKVVVDPYVGRLGIFRIHQGTIKSGGQLYIGDGRKPFKVAHLYKMQGKETREIPAGVPGDICAVAKVDDIHYDAVLHDSHDEDHYHLVAAESAPPMLGLAITPARRGDEQKLSDALQKLGAEDPCLLVEHRASTNETVVRGMGDLHLRVVLERMKERYNVDVETCPPSIAYRETITRKAEGHHRHKKQTGGAGQFGEVFLNVDRLERGAGFEFVNKVVGGTIPTQFIPAVEKGVRQALESGAIAGFPLHDVRVTVYDGKHHPVDSKEVAFVAAGKKAFIHAIEKAGPIILEPIVNVQVTAPGDSMGAISGDLSGRRGKISGNSALPGNRVTVEGEVPLSELNDYQSRLKSMTGGAGTFTMEFNRYEPVPPRTQQELIQSYKKAG